MFRTGARKITTGIMYVYKFNYNDIFGFHISNKRAIIKFIIIIINK